MGGFPEVNDLPARKRALLAESEIYRQTLRLQVQNLRLYGEAARRKLTLVQAAKPLALVGLPLLSTIFLRRKVMKVSKARLGFLGTALTAWRIYKGVSPYVRPLLSQFMARGGAPRPQTPEARGP